MYNATELPIRNSTREAILERRFAAAKSIGLSPLDSIMSWTFIRNCECQLSKMQRPRTKDVDRLIVRHGSVEAIGRLIDRMRNKYGS